MLKDLWTAWHQTWHANHDTFHGRLAFTLGCLATRLYGDDRFAVSVPALKMEHIDRMFRPDVGYIDIEGS